MQRNQSETKKLRLAVFTNQFPGRVNTFFSRDIAALLKAGINVDIFPIYPADSRLWEYVPSILDADILPRERVRHIAIGKALLATRPWPLREFCRFLSDSARITASAIPWGIKPLAKTTYVLPKAMAWALECARDYDHVLAYWGNYSATSAMVFHRLLGKAIPFSLILHAGTDLYRDRVYLRQKLLYADRIYVVCEFNRGFLNRCYPDIYDRIANKIHIHHLGLDLNELPFDVSAKPTDKIIAVGGLTRSKGFDVLLRALHQLRNGGHEAVVELVGSGPEMSSLKSLAEELGLSKSVEFRGWLRPDQVIDAIRNSTVLVHPSVGLGDAVPTVIKEAMALGTAIVASDVAGIPELLDHGRCGMLVPPQDVGALSTAIEKMLSATAVRKRYIVAARRFTEEKFDLSKTGTRLAQLLKRTIQKSQASTRL